MRGKLVKLRGYKKSDVDALIDGSRTWKEASYIGGRYVDVVTMGLLRADFDGARP